MTSWQAIVLGAVQGLTEFLPISSTAHLRIVPWLMGWRDPGAPLTAVLQLGTLLAVLAYFRHDIARMMLASVRGLASGAPLANPDARLAWMIIAGTLPIVVCGLVFKEAIETTLRSLYVIAAALIALALMLMAAEWRSRALLRRTEAAAEGTASRPSSLRDLENVTWADALIIGCAQAAALIPGASRSGVTITAGLSLGLGRSAAARFSFLLSLPAVFAAGCLELYKEHDHMLEASGGVANLLLATGVAFVSGYASIVFLLAYLRTRSTWVFVVYRLALGGFILGALFGGWLEP